VSVFKSEKIIAVKVPDLSPVAADLMKHFKDRGFEVVGFQPTNGHWEINITKGNTFKAVAGLRTALKIELVPQVDATLIRAGAGIFRAQVVPTAINLVVPWHWPLMATQVWGIIHQAGLDNEAVKVVELSLDRLSRLGDTSAGPVEQWPTPENGQWPAPEKTDDGHLDGFCSSCGGQQPAGALFCPRCGTARQR